jgi:hypothetical protein
MSVFQDVYALGSVYIDQNLVVKGTTTSVNTKNLEVKDQFIGLGVGNAMETTASATGLLAVTNVSPYGSIGGYQVISIDPVGNTITLDASENFLSALNSYNITFQLINDSILNNALNTGIYSTASYTQIDGNTVLTILITGANGFRSSLEQEDSTITSNYKLYITDLTKTATVGSVMTVTTYENKINAGNWINYEEKTHTVLYDGDTLNISNEILKTQIQSTSNFPAEFRVTTYIGGDDSTVTLPTPVDGLIKTIINASTHLLTITPTLGSTCEIASLIGSVNMRVTLLYSASLTKWIIV